MEFSIPLLVSAIRGVGRPALGASITDLVTIAPILETSMNWASSRPELAHPEAVMIGFGSSVSPSRTRRSGAMARPLRRVTRGSGPGRPVRRRSRSRRAPHLRLPAGRTERVERDRADLVPADLLAAEDGAVHARPDHPGDAVRSDHRQHAGHADADAAG